MLTCQTGLTFELDLYIVPTLRGVSDQIQLRS